MHKRLSPKKKKFVNDYLIDLSVSRDYKNDTKDEHKDNILE